MTNANHGLIIEKPVSTLNKAIKIDYYKLFISLGRMTLAGSLGDFPKVLDLGIDSLKELSLLNKPEQVAWLLISQAFTKTLVDLVDDYKDLFHQKPNEEKLKKLAKSVEYTLNSVNISIDATFFKRPQDLKFLDDFKSALDFWLTELGWNKVQNDSFHYRMKSRFVFALNEVWANNPSHFRVLEERITTPFTEATLEQQNWQRYNASLLELANERVFNEAFVLKQIYVPLKAYYKEVRTVSRSMTATENFMENERIRKEQEKENKEKGIYISEKHIDFQSVDKNIISEETINVVFDLHDKINHKFNF